MKRDILITTILVLFLLAALVASGAEIEGPDTVETGKPAWFSLKTDPGERAFYLPLPGAPIDTNPKHIATGSALFWTNTPGTYSIIAICGKSWDSASAISKVVIVAGEAPNPPNPPDPPGPNPGGKQQVVIFYETFQLDNLPRGQQVLLKSLEFRKKLKAAEHNLLGIYDINILGSGGTIPKVLEPYVQAAGDKNVPCICIAPIEGGTIKCYDLPADSAATLELIRNGGA